MKRVELIFGQKLDFRSTKPINSKFIRPIMSRSVFDGLISNLLWVNADELSSSQVKVLGRDTGSKVRSKIHRRVFFRRVT